MADGSHALYLADELWAQVKSAKRKAQNVKQENNFL